MPIFQNNKNINKIIVSSCFKTIYLGTSNFFFIGQKICSSPLISKFRCLSCEGISSKTHNFFIFPKFVEGPFGLPKSATKVPKKWNFLSKISGIFIFKANFMKNLSIFGSPVHSHNKTGQILAQLTERLVAKLTENVLLNILVKTRIFLGWFLAGNLPKNTSEPQSDLTSLYLNHKVEFGYSFGNLYLFPGLSWWQSVLPTFSAAGNVGTKQRTTPRVGYAANFLLQLLRTDSLSQPKLSHLGDGYHRE